MKFVLSAFVVSVLVLFVIACFLLVCRKYEEGVFGNLALGFLIALPAATILCDAWRGGLGEEWGRVPPALLVLVIGLGVFVLRHAWRFAMFQWHGRFGWTRPADMEVRRAS